MHLRLAPVVVLVIVELSFNLLSFVQRMIAAIHNIHHLWKMIREMPIYISIGFCILKI